MNKVYSMKKLLVLALPLLFLGLAGCQTYKFYPDAVTVEKRSDDRYDFKTCDTEESNSDVQTNLEAAFEGAEGIFSLDGSIYLSWKDNTYILWDTVTRKRSPSFFTETNILHAAIRPDNRKIVLDTAGSGTLIKDIRTQETVLRNTFGKGSPQALGYTPDGRYLYRVDEDFTKGREYFILWESDTGKFVETVSWKADYIHFRAAAFRDDGELFAVNTNGGGITVFDIPSGSLVSRIPTSNSIDTYGLVFSGEDKNIISMEARTGELTCYRISDGDILWKTRNADHVYSRLAQPREGSLLFVFGYDEKAKIDLVLAFDSETGKLVQDYSADHDFLLNMENPFKAGAVCMSPDDSGFSTVSPSDNTLRKYFFGVGLVDEDFLLAGEAFLKSWAGYGNIFSVPSKNPQLLKFFQANRVDVWDLETGGLHHIFNLPEAAYTTNWDRRLAGPLYILPARNGSLEIWDLDREERSDVIDLGNTPGRKEVKIWEAVFSPDMSRVALLMSNDNVYMWDRKKASLLFSKKVLGAFSVDFIQDGKILAVNRSNMDMFFDSATGEAVKPADESIPVGPDKNYRLRYNGRDYDIVENELTLTLKEKEKEGISLSSTNRGDWFAVLPDGRFDCSDGGRQFIKFTRGNESFSADQFWDRYYTPGLLTVFMNRTLDTVKSDQVTDTLKAAPEVTILSPGDTETDRESISVAVEAKPGSNGVGEVFLYINGKAANSRTRGISVITKELVREFTINLSEGSNIIKAAAFDAGHVIEGWSEPVEVIYKPVRIVKPDLYILSIGVSDYLDEGIRLKAPRKDAKKIGELFGDIGAGLYGEVSVQVLTDEEANMEGIRKAFARISEQAETRDTVILFCAGHGYTEDKIYYFLPREANITDLPGSALSVNEIGEFTNRLAAKKIAVLLDTCQSGDAAKSLGRMAMARGFDERKAIADLAKKSGIIVFAATSPGAAAYEIEELGYGIFTHSIITALTEMPGSVSRNSLVSINLLMTEVEQLTRETGYEYLKIDQIPIKYNFGEDFDIGVLKQ